MKEEPRSKPVTSKERVVKMEQGQSSGSKPSLQIWAKLVPSEPNYKSIEISSNDTMVCSKITSTSDILEWCQIVRSSDRCSATIRNKRSDVILVDGIALQSGAVVSIKSGSEIVPDSVRKGISYKFEVMAVQDECAEKTLKIAIDADHTKCGICLNVWHDAVTVAPCLHNFCNGCFSEWLKRCQEKRSSVLCPHCRTEVESVGRNHFLNGIKEDILKADASLRRSAEELAVLDSQAFIKSNLVITKGSHRKRARSSIPTHEESDEVEPCPQCGTQYGGFRCNESTIHLPCHECGGLMPSRTHISTPQQCVGCDRAFCGAYWHAQGAVPTNDHPMCSVDTFKPISERSMSIIPPVAHERNQFEQDITYKCIQHIGKTVQEVVAEWVRKLNAREIDRLRMPLLHPDIVTATTYLCKACYEKLVSFLLYWFRLSLPNHLLPREALGREDCWYGYACRTQHHNVAHARKLNHVCRPTRGTGM